VGKKTGMSPFLPRIEMNEKQYPAEKLPGSAVKYTDFVTGKRCQEPFKIFKKVPDTFFLLRMESKKNRHNSAGNGGEPTRGARPGT
jgi:hypothetical protein